MYFYRTILFSSSSFCFPIFTCFKQLPSVSYCTFFSYHSPIVISSTLTLQIHQFSPIFLVSPNNLQTHCENFVSNVHKLLANTEGKPIVVIAKIENATGIYNLEEIVKVADAILLSKSALAKELPPEKVFLAQKTIAGNCNKVRSF